MPEWTFGAADFDGQHVVHLTGGVQLRQGDRLLQTSELSIDQESGSLSVPGAVELSDPNLTVRGADAHASSAGTVEIDDANFAIPARAGHGRAESIVLSKEGMAELHDVHYTTCADPNPAWALNIGRLSIDNGAHEGSARNAWVAIKGVPVLYTPYISFPIGNERKTGFLFPTIGNSTAGGAQVATPWYWNIAPNYDATLTPTWYAQRGVDIGTEFRYLTDRMRGTAQLNYLPNDQVAGQDRAFAELQTLTDLSSDLRLYADGSGVSDANWFDDFGTGEQRTGVTELLRAARVIYRSAEWSLTALAQNYQTIDPDLTLEQRPYTILPRVALDGHFPDKLGLTFDVAGEYTNFRTSQHSTAPDGQRLDTEAEVRWPLRRPGMYFEPAAGLRYTAYRLEQPLAGFEDDAPARTAPIFSLDTGLTFDRPSGRSGERVQTLEPRILYLYVPYREQAAIPIFDTQLPDFNLIQLFRTNRYVGADRLGDANQIAAGVTTRLLDAASGRQFLAATLGEIYRFQAPKVALPNEVVATNHASDLIGDVQLTAYKHWSASVGVQWDPNNQRLQRTEASLQFLTAPAHVVNVGYVYRRASATQDAALPSPGTPQQTELRQVYSSAAWPVGTRISLYGRYVYSLDAHKMIDGLAGIEYRSCCWGFRFGARRTVSSTGELENAWQWQIELNGLANVGAANDAFLAQAIQGYSAVRTDVRSVP